MSEIILAEYKNVQFYYRENKNLDPIFAISLERLALATPKLMNLYYNEEGLDHSLLNPNSTASKKALELMTKMINELD